MENFLKPLTGKPKKYKIATFDIEANNWKDFLIAGFYDGNEYKEFKSIDYLLSHCLQSKYLSYRIFAHFAGKYDFLFLLNRLKDRASIIEVNGRIILLKVRFKSGDKDKYIYFVDSFSLLLTSLDKVTKAFNVKHRKQSGKIDFSKKLKITKQLKEYLKFDVIGLYEVLEEFQEQLNLLNTEMKITIASTSMDMFRRNYLKHNLPQYPQHEEFIRSGYYGGRVEVYKKYFNIEEHKTPIKYYDFNSLYPSVMASKLFPVGNPVTISNYKFNPLDVGFSYIETQIPKNILIPPIPVKENFMLYYKTGKISGVYPHVYLKILKNMGIPFKIHKTILFERDFLFKGFANDIYNERLKNKNNAKGYILKILLNSLYGKFAQKRNNKEYILTPDLEELKKGLYLFNADLDLWYNETESKSLHLLPGISAYVTAYAHEKLYNIISLFPDKIFYCDTDSIFTTEQLPTSNSLGDLKIEDEIQEAIFLNPKFYAYTNLQNKQVLKAKGFFHEQLKYEYYKHALFENDFSVFNQQKTRLMGFKSAIISKQNKNKDFLFLNEFKKSVKSIDKKRKFSKFNSTAINAD